MHKKAIVRWLMFIIVVFLSLQIRAFAQEASAEYITSIAPAKM